MMDRLDLHSFLIVVIRIFVIFWCGLAPTGCLLVEEENKSKELVYIRHYSLVSPADSVESYLLAWRDRDYESVYRIRTLDVAQDAISRDKFVTESRGQNDWIPVIWNLTDLIYTVNKTECDVRALIVSSIEGYLREEEVVFRCKKADLEWKVTNSIDIGEPRILEPVATIDTSEKDN